jgi:hypothetical protein
MMAQRARQHSQVPAPRPRFPIHRRIRRHVRQRRNPDTSYSPTSTSGQRDPRTNDRHPAPGVTGPDSDRQRTAPESGRYGLLVALQYRATAPIPWHNWPQHKPPASHQNRSTWPTTGSGEQRSSTGSLTSISPPRNRPYHQEPAGQRRDRDFEVPQASAGAFRRFLAERTDYCLVRGLLGDRVHIPGEEVHIRLEHVCQFTRLVRLN